MLHNNKVCIPTKLIVLSFIFITISLFIILFSALTNKGTTTTNSRAAELNESVQIIGGNNAAPGQFPFVVGLYEIPSYFYYDQKTGEYHLSQAFFCTGTLINSRWVLTAAHCLFNPDTKNLRTDPIGVLFGTVNLNGIISQGSSLNNIQRKSIAIYPHPNYVLGNKYAVNQANDIALIQLDSPVTGIIFPSFPDKSMADVYNRGSSVTSIGFGISQYKTFGPLTPTPVNLIDRIDRNSIDLLHYIDWTVVFSHQYEFDVGLLTQTKPKTTVMFGDSGGPTIAYYNNKIYIIGVHADTGTNVSTISGGSDTRISEYVEWINTILNNSSTQSTSMSRELRAITRTPSPSVSQK